MAIFGKKADDVAAEDEQQNQQQASALLDLETRMRAEFQRFTTETHQRLKLLEKRVADLEAKHETAGKTTVSLQDRVTSLEGILKKAEEAGKRRRGATAARAGGAAAAAAGATPSRRVQRTPSRGRGLGRTASGRNLASSDDDETKSHEDGLDAAGNPVVPSAASHDEEQL